MKTGVPFLMIVIRKNIIQVKSVACSMHAYKNRANPQTCFSFKFSSKRLPANVYVRFPFTIVDHKKGFSNTIDPQRIVAALMI